jgi:hypothetical protein
MCNQVAQIERGLYLPLLYPIASEPCNGDPKNNLALVNGLAFLPYHPLVNVIESVSGRIKRI